MSCPFTTRKLIKVEKALKDNHLEAELIIVTLDPRMDTPAKLNTYYRKGFGIQSPHWHFLRGKSEDTHALADFLKITFEEIDEHIRHDNKFVLTDSTGSIKKTIDGWDTELSGLYPQNWRASRISSMI